MTFPVEHALRINALAATVEALRHPAAKKVSFSIPGCAINDTHLERVRKALADGALDVDADLAMSGAHAKFWQEPMRIRLSQTAMRNLTSPDIVPLVFHECVHAAQHLTGQYGPTPEREAAGYIAMLIYHLERYDEFIISSSVPEKTRDLFVAAKTAAQKAMSKPNLAEEDVADLKAAIAGHPVYEHQV